MLHAREGRGSFALLASPHPASLPHIYNIPLILPPHPFSLSLRSGLLGGHFAAIALKSQGYKQLVWYQDELLRKAEEVGRRLLPAFETTTGLPYPKVRQEGELLPVSLIPRSLHLGSSLGTGWTGS